VIAMLDQPGADLCPGQACQRLSVLVLPSVLPKILLSFILISMSFIQFNFLFERENAQV
jgi:cell shape-determining protein MreD